MQSTDGSARTRAFAPDVIECTAAGTGKSHDLGYRVLNRLGL